MATVAQQTYEQRLAANGRWAMAEASSFFEGGGAVNRTLARIAKRLDELRIPYAVAGGMALFKHGVRRFTEDVGILVDAAGLETVHAHLDGLGYVPSFSGSKNLRDAESGVKIEFLIAGQFPGDGKPIAFPAPQSVAIVLDGISYLRLESLIELKLASGMSNPDRMKDITDVYELIKALRLEGAFAQRLNPFVQAKFAELCATAREFGESSSE